MGMMQCWIYKIHYVMEDFVCFQSHKADRKFSCNTIYLAMSYLHVFVLCSKIQSDVYCDIYLGLHTLCFDSIVI